MINVLRYNDSINNKTALPNRLYNSTINGIPMIAFKGTYLSEIIEKYKLGLVLESFDNVEIKIQEYINNFAYNDYEELRKMFLVKVIKENEYFYKEIKKFIKSI